jgi:hypothetical protein
VSELPAAREAKVRLQVDGALVDGEQLHPGELAEESKVVAVGSGSLTSTAAASWSPVFETTIS